MPNWAYNKIYARTKADFDRLTECVLNHEQMDFNRIIPMPRELERIPADFMSIDRIAYAIGDGDPVDRIMVCDHIKSKYPQVIFTSDGASVDVKLDGSTTKSSEQPSQETVFFDMHIVDQIVEKSKSIDKQRVAKDDKRALNDPVSPFNTGLTWKQIGMKTLNAIITCGATNWYDWCTANWGTKWNAGETVVNDEELSIYFQTAWSPVDQLMKRLSEKTGLSLYMEYSEEQFSAFAGELVFVAGNTVDSIEANGDDWDTYRIAAHMQDPDEECHRYSDETGIITDYGDIGDDDISINDIDCQDDLTSPMYRDFMAGCYELATLAEDDA